MVVFTLHLYLQTGIKSSLFPPWNLFFQNSGFKTMSMLHKAEIWSEQMCASGRMQQMKKSHCPAKRIY